MIEPIDVLEALLFASDAPVEVATIQDVLELPSTDAARELLTALRARLEQQGALQVIEAGGGFRLVTRPEVAPWLVRLARSKTKSRLSRPALETLAIVAYRQPVSRPEVDATRGVNSEGVLDNLLERRLIRIAGRKESPGRPFLYETTREFLVAFGLRDLGDLPKVDGDLVVADPAAASAAAGSAETVDAGREDEAIAIGSGPASDGVEIAPGDGEGTVAGGEVAAEELDRDVRARTPASADASIVGDADPAVPSSGPAGGDAARASGDANVGDGGAEPAAPEDALRAGAAAIGSGSDSPPALPADHPAATEDASTAEHPPQQDPRAGGADVAARG